MGFTDDTRITLLAAVVLANTSPDASIGGDTLTSLDDLDSWYDEHLLTSHRAAGSDELDSIREIRPVLYDLLSADRDGAAEIVNALLSEANAIPQLVRHDQWDWHLHAVPTHAPPATRIVVDTAMAMMDFVRDDEMSRLGICADADCRGIVLDLSRNRSKRFCSTACGNRNAVAAYRARQASG